MSNNENSKPTNNSMALNVVESHNVPSQPRQPRNLQDLLRYASEIGAQDPSSGSNSLGQLDPERQKFLEDVFKSMTVDIARELSDAIATLKQLEGNESAESPQDPCTYEAALDRIAEHVDNLDAANDFYKLGGFDITFLCLTSPHSGIRWRMADIIAQCTQNNPFCQEHALSRKFLKPLVTMVDEDENDDCKVKAFFAVASIVRDNSAGLKEFINLDGFSVVLRGMRSNVERLRNKASFFLSSMISKNPEIKVTLFEMGFIEQLISLIGGEHSTHHEHIMSALLSLVENFPEAQAECRMPEFDLESLLTDLLNEYSYDEAFREEMSYIRTIMKIVFPKESEEER